MMKNIAVTGMTASQYSRSRNSSSLSFVACLSDAATMYGDDVRVSWIKPSVSHAQSDFEEYDAILVGLSPLLSLASHCAYGVLNVVGMLKGDQRLHFYIDAPDPAKIRQSLSAIVKTPESLKKPIYKNRNEYSKVSGSSEIVDRLAESAEYLYSDKNYRVLYPAFSFTDDVHVSRKLFGEDSLRMVPFNFDALYTRQEVDAVISAEKSKLWLVENHKTRWFERMKNLLSYDWEPVKIKRMQPDTVSLDRICRSTGTIICPQNDSITWWTYRLVQSLAALVPICTEWRDTISIGQSWSAIPQAVESMSIAERYSLALEQLEQYSLSIRDAETETSRLFKELSL